MALPPEHAVSLHRTGYPVRPDGDLTPQERELLHKYGYWLEALATGTLALATPEQEQFVRVSRGEADPQTPFEIAWMKERHPRPRSGQPVGPMEVSTRLARLAAARSAAEAMQEEYSARRTAILEQVREQLDAVDAEFADRLQAVNDEAARAEAEARETVLRYGASFRHAGISAAYSPGRVSWDSKGLTEYARSFPEILEFRRVGKPFVALRFDASAEASEPGGEE